MKDVAKSILAIHNADGSSLARVISLSGFGGRNTGELLGILGKEFVGSLMYGSFDSELINMKKILDDQDANGVTRVISTGDKDAVASGLACGGIATIALERITGLLQRALVAISKKLPVGIATRIDNDVAETVAIQILGETTRVDPNCKFDEDFISQTSLILSDLVKLRRDSSTVKEVKGIGLHFQVYVAPSEVLVVGESVLAQALQAQFELLGIETHLKDDVDTALEILAEFGPNDALILLTHDMEVGLKLCEQSFEIPEMYIGALGSRHTQELRRKLLEAAGFSLLQVNSIFGPVGFDIGAKTPSETAVAIVAEFLAHKNGRSGLSLVVSNDPING